MEKSMKSKTLAPLYILQILQKYSDSEHLLEQSDLIQKLKEEHEIIIERKTVARIIANLVSAGYDVVNTRRGYYLASKPLEDDELQLLIDSVLFSRHISNKYAKDLIDKLAELGGPSLTKNIKHLARPDSVEREDNKQLFWNVAQASEAISDKHKTSFICSAYGYDKQLRPVWEKPVTVSPLRLAVARNHYYLIAVIDGNDCPTNFRLDKLSQMKVLNEPIDGETAKLLSNEKLDEYLRSHPLMYCGKSQKVTIRADKIIFDDIIDTFGKDFLVLKQDEYTVTVTLCANQCDIVEWALQNAAFVEILAPQHIRNGLIKNAETLANRYLTTASNKEKTPTKKELDKVIDESLDEYSDVIKALANS